VDNEMMRPGIHFRLDLCVLFSAMTLLFGWQERHLAQKTHSTNFQRYFFRRGKRLRAGEPVDSSSAEKCL